MKAAASAALCLATLPIRFPLALALLMLWLILSCGGMWLDDDHGPIPPFASAKLMSWPPRESDGGAVVSWWPL